ncbi:mitogen-activated protein kinase 15-like isoform X4 [Rhododendron vialii]|uniref:mitogen-activated protein kinase 15-like isoform X4 n=1 Tax=Rhododendron vialii TaxID=182163 RepID=UPI00265ECDA4|nr:mitogen-activated protein kinase 15-like isoform X4 [Rhododendron vialii]
MSLLGPVGGLVWEIVSTTVVTYAVPWLSEFVAQRILPLWQRYWPVIYQSVLVPAYHLVSDTIQPLLHDLLSNHGDSSAVSASESPPGGTLPLDQKTLDPPQDHDSLTVSNVSNGLVSDHEDIIGTSLSEMHTPLDGGGTVESNIVAQASDPILNPTSSISSNHKDMNGIATSEYATLIEGGTTQFDQNILGRALEPILDSTSNLPSDLENVTERAATESDTLSGRGTQASADIDFFREYCEGRRYTIQEVIGKGSHGVVWSAYDTQHREKVAIKKISDVFRHVSDATRILREIKLLRILRHDDILKIKHILLPPSRGDFKDIYIVFELTECDLRSVIKANNGLKPEHCRYFLYQLLRGLKYIHTANVFHRDLNPRNILTIADCKIKIRHFSHAFVDNPTAMFWTDYVATRWYKAPELCGQFFSKYSAAIDIWSIGCIFAELLTGKPLFPGENPVHQLDLITDLLGTPSPESIAKIKNEKAHASLTSMRKKRPIPFPQKFPNADPLALVLLKRMLAFDPEDRPSAEEALADPYFKELARLESEPSAQPVTEADFAFERLNVTKEHIRELIYLEILQYHPKLLKKEHIEIPESNGCQSFSRRRRMLAKVASIAPMKLLHHPHPHLHPHPS